MRDGFPSPCISTTNLSMLTDLTVPLREGTTDDHTRSSAWHPPRACRDPRRPSVHQILRTADRLDGTNDDPRQAGEENHRTFRQRQQPHALRKALTSTGWHVLRASAPVAILVVGEERPLHPAVAAGALYAHPRCRPALRMTFGRLKKSPP
jgi:hypothetical protein